MKFMADMNIYIYISIFNFVVVVVIFGQLSPHLHQNA